MSHANILDNHLYVERRLAQGDESEARLDMVAAQAARRHGAIDAAVLRLQALRESSEDLSPAIRLALAVIERDLAKANRGRAGDPSPENIAAATRLAAERALAACANGGPDRRQPAAAAPVGHGITSERCRACGLRDVPVRAGEQAGATVCGQCAEQAAQFAMEPGSSTAIDEPKISRAATDHR